MLTAYDYPTALILNQAEIDIILVGDTLGMVVLGYETTRDVTVTDMIHHTSAVKRGNETCLIVSDLPYQSDKTSDLAVENAKQLISTGADAVKIEGNKTEIIGAIINEGIPVMGHVGLLPQTTETFRVRGRKEREANQILEDAISLEQVGCFAVVLECIPNPVAERITESLSIPTIGIGAGASCDGQVLVIHDLIGLFDRFRPSFAKQFTNVKKEILRAVESYKFEVQQETFPDADHCGGYRVACQATGSSTSFPCALLPGGTDCLSGLLWLVHVHDPATNAFGIDDQHSLDLAGNTRLFASPFLECTRWMNRPVQESATD